MPCVFPMCFYTYIFSSKGKKTEIRDCNRTFFSLSSTSRSRTIVPYLLSCVKQKQSIADGGTPLLSKETITDRDVLQWHDRGYPHLHIRDHFPGADLGPTKLPV